MPKEKIKSIFDGPRALTLEIIEMLRVGHKEIFRG